jgi:hypothetical protein
MFGGIITYPSVAVSAINKTHNNAPSVRLLGAGVKPAVKTFEANNNTSSKKASSVRTLGMTVKPQTNKQLNKTANNNIDRSSMHTNLLKGIGKKIAVTPSIKPSQPTQPTTSGTTIPADLEQRITNLQNDIDSKQNILTAGNGIDINGNIISLSEQMQNLPERIEEINQKTDNLTDQINNATLPQNYYTVDETEEYLQQHYYTKQYVDAIVNQLSNANVVKNFDPSFLTKD